LSVSRGYPVQRDHRIGRNTDVHDHHDLKFVVPANLLGAGSSVESAVLSLTAQDLPVGRQREDNGGQHVAAPVDEPMCNLLLTMLDRAGVPAETLGDSTGKFKI